MPIGLNGFRAITVKQRYLFSFCRHTMFPYSLIYVCLIPYSIMVVLKDSKGFFHSPNGTSSSVDRNAMDSEVLLLSVLGQTSMEEKKEARIQESYLLEREREEYCINRRICRFQQCVLGEMTQLWFFLLY